MNISKKNLKKLKKSLKKVLKSFENSTKLKMQMLERMKEDEKIKELYNLQTK